MRKKTVEEKLTAEYENSQGRTIKEICDSLGITIQAFYYYAGKDTRLRRLWLERRQEQLAKLAQSV